MAKISAQAKFQPGLSYPSWNFSLDLVHHVSTSAQTEIIVNTSFTVFSLFSPRGAYSFQELLRGGRLIGKGGLIERGELFIHLKNSDGDYLFEMQ